MASAAYAASAGTATDPTKLPLAGGTLSGLLYANKGVSAKATGTIWGGWNQVYTVNTGSHGALYNPTGGTFVGLHSNSNIYFGKSESATSGQYYGWIGKGGFYNGSGQALATQAYVNSKVASAGGIVAQSLGTNGYVKFSNGLIIQWGIGYTFPIPFPNACYTVSANTYTNGANGGGGSYNGFYIKSWTRYGFSAYSHVEDIGSRSASFIAVGY